MRKLATREDKVCIRISQLQFTNRCKIAQRQWIESESDPSEECASLPIGTQNFSLTGLPKITLYSSVFPFWSKTISEKDFSGSQNKAALIRCGPAICIDAPRMTIDHTGLRFALLGVFIKTLRVDFSKPREDGKPSQEFTITCHLQYPVSWWQFLSSWGPQNSLGFLSLPGSAPSSLTCVAGNPVRPVTRPVCSRETL